MGCVKTGFTQACAWCGEMYYVEAYRAGESKFCSMECVYKGRPKPKRKGEYVKCEQCGKKYYVTQGRKEVTRFCSASCTNKGTLQEREPARLKTIVKHGMKGTPEFTCWCAMKSRCKGGWYLEKGITVCPEWQKDFMAFYNHLGPIPGLGYTVDRYPNNLGNYEPGNVRWATKAEQGWSKKGKKASRKTRRLMSIKHRGENNATAKLTEADVRAIRALTGTGPYEEIGKKFGVSYWTVRDIQKRRSWKHLE
jgi:hypothetical protein